MVLAIARIGDHRRRHLQRRAGWSAAPVTRTRGCARVGVFLPALGEASESGGPAAVLRGRLASVPGARARAAGTPRRAAPPRGSDALAIAALGALNALAANLAYAGAAAAGAGAAVAVLGSLYPLTTVLLARALLHAAARPSPFRRRRCGARRGGAHLAVGVSARLVWALRLELRR